MARKKTEVDPATGELVEIGYSAEVLKYAADAGVDPGLVQRIEPVGDRFVRVWLNGRPARPFVIVNKR